MFDDQKSEIGKSYQERTTPHRRAEEGPFIGPEVISKHSVVLVNSYLISTFTMMHHAVLDIHKFKVE